MLLLLLTTLKTFGSAKALQLWPAARSFVAMDSKTADGSKVTKVQVEGSGKSIATVEPALRRNFSGKYEAGVQAIFKKVG